MKRVPILFLLLSVAAWSSVDAQIQIDKRRPANSKGHVYIENSFGSLEVVGWDKDEVTVTGTLAGGAEGISFEGEPSEVWVGVSVPDSWFYQSDDDSEYQSHLVIHVPSGSSVGVDTTNATVTLTGIDGSVEVETVNGSITVDGAPSSVDIETMTGEVNVKAQAAEMEVETISGAVSLRGATQAVYVRTVSGPIEINGDGLEEINVETTTGTVRIDSSFVETGEVDIETFDGTVELITPEDVKARFECVTFSGQIQNGFGPKPRKEGRFTPFSKLSFSTGLNEFEVSIETYSGDIVLSKRSNAAARSQ